MEKKLIFNVVLGLIREGRFHTATMSDIAYYARITEHTAGLFFKSKEMIVAQLADDIVAQAEKAILDATKGELIFETKFLRVWKALHALYTRNSEIIALISQSAFILSLSNIRNLESRLEALCFPLFASAPKHVVAEQTPAALAPFFHASIVHAARIGCSKDHPFNEGGIHQIALQVWQGMTIRQWEAQTV